MFKRQMQKFIKNRRYSLMRAANNGEVKPEDCHEVHWENILKLRSKEVKIRQSAAMKVVRSKQMSQSHAGRGGESTARDILVSYFLNPFGTQVIVVLEISVLKLDLNSIACAYFIVGAVGKISYPYSKPTQRYKRTKEAC